jgi:hypothetical protein
MLARHADELKELDVEKHQLDSLEQAINTFFARRFYRSTATEGLQQRLN